LHINIDTQIIKTKNSKQMLVFNIVTINMDIKTISRVKHHTNENK